MSRSGFVCLVPRTLLLALFLLFAAPAAHALTIGFDGLVGGTDVTTHEESGFRVTSSQWIFTSTFLVPDPPAIFHSQASGTFTLERVSERPFEVSSIAIRELNESVGPTTIEFTGTLAAGGTVTTTFVTDGVCCDLGTGFETFAFPESFRGLRSLTWVRLGVTSGGVYDDIVVDFPAVRFDEIDSGVTAYVEDGLVVSSNHPIFIDEFTTPEPPSIFASQGFQTFWLRPESGGVFDLFAFEAREFNDTIGATEVTLVGRRLDGSVVEATFTSDGVCCGGDRFGFELFELPETFRQLVEVEWDQTDLTYDTFEATPAAPENDDADAALPLPAEGGSFPGTLVRASNDAAVTLGDSDASADVWYSLSPATTTAFTVDTCGSHDAAGEDTGVDTVVTVHDALPATDGNQLAGNDDAPDGDDPEACAGLDGGAEQRGAALVVLVPGGSTAWIRVARAGRESGGGDFVLNVPEPGAGVAGATVAAALLALARRRRVA